MNSNKNKMWLAIIVAVVILPLLLAGCMDASGRGAPGFLKEGVYYEAEVGGGVERIRFKLLEIRGDGWVLAEAWGRGEKYWLNTAQIAVISEIPKPTR